jgi:uncharacterized membrane protein YtjA (UPF0391 family)
MLFWGIIFLVSFWVLGVLCFVGAAWATKEELPRWINEGQP